MQGTGYAPHGDANAVFGQSLADFQTDIVDRRADGSDAGPVSFLAKDPHPPLVLVRHPAGWSSTGICRRPLREAVGLPDRRGDPCLLHRGREPLAHVYQLFNLSGQCRGLSPQPCRRFSDLVLRTLPGPAVCSGAYAVDGPALWSGAGGMGICAAGCLAWIPRPHHSGSSLAAHDLQAGEIPDGSHMVWGPEI